MTGSDERFEDLLRAALHRVDDLDAPPAPDFAARAMAAAQTAPDDGVDDVAAVDDTGRSHGSTSSDELLTRAPVVALRRRRWPQLLLGSAAAVLVVLGLGYTVTHLPGGSTSASSSAGVAEPGVEGYGGDASATTAAAAGTDVATAVIPFATAVGSGGSDGSADGGANLAIAVAQLRTTLSQNPYDDSVSAVASSTTAGSVVVYVTRLDDALTALVAKALPDGTPISFVRASYSARACASTLARVTSDLMRLSSLGGTLTDPRCNDLGRVVVTARNGLAALQRSEVRSMYGGAVSVVDSGGRPLG